MGKASNCNGRSKSNSWGDSLDNQNDAIDRYEMIKRAAEKVQDRMESLFLPGELGDDERYSD